MIIIPKLKTKSIKYDYAVNNKLHTKSAKKVQNFVQLEEAWFPDYEENNKYGFSSSVNRKTVQTFDIKRVLERKIANR